VFEEDCVVEPESEHVENAADDGRRTQMEEAGAQVESTLLVQRRICFGRNQSHLKI